MKNIFKKSIAILLVIMILCASAPQKSYAFLGVGDTTFATIVADVSPTGITNAINHELQQLKSFILDHLATLIAKQILHQITASVINWINSGFQGSPSFITNPGGFFLNAADQISGAFLDKDTGPLKNLCGSLGTDLSLTLALGQTFNNNKAYSCTLGSIFNNVKNIPGNTRVNGRSLDGFMKGDFSQGGWNGFLAVTQNPQNNGTGAYLQGHSDLLQAIGVKHNSINQQLLQGSGFLSWESCKNVPVASAPGLISSGAALPSLTNAYNNAINADLTNIAQGTGMGLGQLSSGRSIVAQGGTSVQNTIKQCETQTPGSVIASKLTKNLNVPETELELANDINAIVDALISQMVSQLLSAGLGALSGGGSGGKSSYTQKIIDEDLSAKEGSTSLGIATGGLSDAKSNYDQAVSLILDSQNRFETAQTCFKDAIQKTNPRLTIVQKNYANDQIRTIDNTLNNDVNPYLTTLQSKETEISTQIDQTNSLNGAVSDQTSLTGLRAQIPNIKQGVETTTKAENTYVKKSENDLTSAENKATKLNIQALAFQSACKNIDQVNALNQNSFGGQ
ncbi:MAG: hypothetical protein WCG07_00385 [Candidatus Taylorbacteria bacterium]